jgi:hypothetical protein
MFKKLFPIAWQEYQNAIKGIFSDQAISVLQLVMQPVCLSFNTFRMELEL